MSSVTIEGLRDFVSENLYDGTERFISLSVMCTDEQDALRTAQLMGAMDASFDGEVEVSRAGVHAVELACEGGMATVLIGWQGEKPSNGSDDTDEDDSDSDDNE